MRCLLLISALAITTQYVEAAGPSIESVAPSVGQRGTEFTVKIVGAGLTDAKELLLYSPGITCDEIKVVSDNELSIRLRAATDCALGSHPFRVCTPRGTSELRILRVTPLLVVVATEPNETTKQAMPIPNNVTVTGVLDAGDVDCFQLTLRRGERLAAEIEAVRLGGSLVDTVLTVIGPEGNRLVSVDDTPLFGQDPFLSLIAPSDGVYCVQVQEANLEGNENSRYALHVGQFPRPAYVYPAGGPVGKSISVRFEGDAIGAFDQKVDLPISPVGEFGLYARHLEMTSPTAIPFRVSPFENVLEIEPNDDPAAIKGNSVELPIAFNGILDRNGDVDCFRFRSNAGQTFLLEAFADRVGSPADTVISILDSEGTVLVANDDGISHDSRLVFQTPRTSEYRIRVVDKRGAGGANFLYRIEVSVPHPALVSFLPRPDRLSQERQAISVPRGNRVMTFLAVQRQGVESKVQLVPQGLPAGVGRFFATVAADQFLVPVVIEAEHDAPISSGLVRILATGEADGSTVTGEFRQVVDLVNASADRLYQAVSVDRLAISVVDAAPFKIRLDEPKSPLVQDGTIELTVHIDRSSEFTDPVDVTFPFLPPWVDGPAKITIPADKSSGVYLAHAFPQAEPRLWQVCAEARPAAVTARESMPVDVPRTPATRRGRRGRPTSDVAVASQLVELNIAKSPVTGTIGKVAAEQGKTFQVFCSLDRHGTLPSQLQATLEGLPNRVHAKPVTVGQNDSRVEFAIRLDESSPIGAFDGLVCRLTGTIEGQGVSYSVGRGGILKIKPAGGLVTDADGRPLSPLEALRRTQKPFDREIGGSR